MWVGIRPRGGQEYDLLRGEGRRSLGACPIHRFDGIDQLPLAETANALRGTGAGILLPDFEAIKVLSL